MRTSILLYILTAVIIGLTVWSYETSIDIAVRSRGIARPTHEVVKVVANVSGNIATVDVQEASSVRRGDILLTVDATAELLRLQALQSQIHFSELRLMELDGRLSSLETLNAAAADVDATELNASIGVVQTTLSQARARQTRTMELFELGIASRQALDESRSETARAEADASRLTGSSVELKRAQAEARLRDLAAERTPLAASIASAYKEMEELRLEIDKRTVTAPVSGRIASAPALHRGEFITAGAPIASLLPESDALVVESLLSSADRAFVSTGQPVRLRMETSSTVSASGFDGMVSAVSPDVRVNDSGFAAYRVIIVPKDAEMLRLGATFDVHFITHQERLLFLLIERIRREFQEAF